VDDLIEGLLSHEGTAIVDARGETRSYAELRDAVARATIAGVAGHAVAVRVSDPAGYLVASLAALRSGAALVPLDARRAAHDATLRAVRPAALVTAASLDGDLELQTHASPRTFSSAVALVLPTSGSSGVPKRVLLGRDGILHNVDAILDYLPVRQSPRTAVVLPLSYSYGLVGQCFTTLRAGGTLLLLGDLDFASQHEAMRRLGARGLSSVPASLRQLAELSEDAPLALDYVASAGAPLDARTREAVLAGFPGARFFNQYGLTEASPRVMASERAVDPEAFDAGALRPIRGAECRLHDVSEGVGELVVRSPGVMLGYLDDDEGTAAVLRDGALHTGDLMQARGDAFVPVGRRDDLVKIAGERVSTLAVTAALQALPSVRDAAVVARQSPRTGTKLVALVVGEPQARAEARTLPAAWRPILRFVDALPRRDNGKLDRAALDELAR